MQPTLSFTQRAWLRLLEIKMKNLLCLMALLVSWPVLASNSSWKTQEIGPGVTVQFPDVAVKQQKDNNTYFAFKGEAGGDRYSLIALKVGMHPGAIKSDKDSNEAYEGMIESFEKRGTMVSNDSTDLHGLRARKFVVNMQEGVKMQAVAVIAGDALYTFQFISADAASSAEEVKAAFFDSIQIDTKAMAPAEATKDAAQSAATPDASNPRDAGRQVGRIFGIALLIGLPILFIVRSLRRKKQK